MIDHLIEQGADVNYKDKDGFTPLHNALNLPSQIETARYLLKVGADINAQTYKEKWTPLHFAVSNSIGNEFDDVIRMLLDAGADQTLKDSDGRTAMDIYLDLQSAL
jgi:ankyrin repeat protein